MTIHSCETSLIDLNGGYACFETDRSILGIDDWVESARIEVFSIKTQGIPVYLRVLLCFYQSRSNQIAQKDTISRNYAGKFSEVGVKSLSLMFVFGAQRDQNSISATIVTFGQRNTVDTLENQFSMRLIGFLMVNSLARNLPLKSRISISLMLENRVDSTERMDFIRSRYFGPENLYRLVEK